MENKEQLKSQDNKLITPLEFKSILDILVEGQVENKEQVKVIQKQMQLGFIGLGLRNEELLKSNHKLEQQLADVVEELNQIKKERQEKEIRKQTRMKRKRLPKRDPMTREIYNELIKAAELRSDLDVD